MNTQCDNESVGIIARNGDTIALIERRNFPLSYALPAGHLDGYPPEPGAKKELAEEVSLNAKELKLLFTDTFQNSCRREGGDHHTWYVFEAVEWEGEIHAATDAKNARWAPLEEVKNLAQKTENFLKKEGITIDNLAEATRIIGNSKEFQEDPGLEPVWVVILRRLNIIL